ncbi:MAG: protein-L-isoaspartate(D-aspartate) O-methyltransferase [Myxococcaceae bacterium]
MRGTFVLMLLLVGASEGSAPPRRWAKVLTAHGIKDPRLFEVFESVRRVDFLPEDQRANELEDRPLPIGLEQTTSQPSLIALMLEELELRPGCRVLEVGTGSGYQTALLGKLCEQVSSVEILPALAQRSAARLEELGYKNVKVKAGDGYLGWPERGPFDGIVVSAGAAKVPAPLVEQLKPGGRLIVPVGEPEEMQLVIVEKSADGKLTTRRSIPVRFVPLTGKPADRDRQR